MSQGPLSGSTSALAQSLALDTAPEAKTLPPRHDQALLPLGFTKKHGYPINSVFLPSPAYAPGHCRTSLFHGFTSHCSPYGEEEETEGQESAAHSQTRPSAGNQTF